MDDNGVDRGVGEALLHGEGGGEGARGGGEGGGGGQGGGRDGGDGERRHSFLELTQNHGNYSKVADS